MLTINDNRTSLGWTIERVKSELPEVDVLCGTITRRGRITGRCNRFATVTVSTDHGMPAHSAEVTWSVLVHCLTFSAPIRF